MSGSTKLMTAGGGGVSLTPASSIASDVTVNVPSQNCTLGIQGPAFSAVPATGTSLTGTVFTKITYDSEEFDTNNNFSSSRFTPTVAGYYQFNWAVYFNSSSGSERATAIYKNGSAYKWSNDLQISGAIVMSGSALVYLNGSTDYVEIYGYSSNSITTGTTTHAGCFQGCLVRAA
jgi:hypothetical protein